MTALRLSFFAVFAFFCTFTAPNGHPVYISPPQVVTVVDAPGLGGAPTEIVTSQGTRYVRESVDAVLACLRGH